MKLLTREHNNRAWLAWHITALGRSKRLPKLQSMFAGTQKRARQTWQQQMQVMDMWAAVTKRIYGKPVNESRSRI